MICAAEAVIVPISGTTATEIVGGVRDLIASGELTPRDLLPPVRTLAAELGVNRNTVAAAYRQLVAAGVAATHGRGGTMLLNATTAARPRPNAPGHITPRKEPPAMFTGLSAFPLTPMSESGIDEQAYAWLVARLASAGVDSIGALGSTGSYAYLSREQRARAARIAVEAAEGTPVIVGIGALRTSQVLALAEDAQKAGASAVLLAPMTYQPLTEDEVFGLYEDVTRELSVPLCVYDNPNTTHVHFTDELHARIAGLPQVAAIKIPPVPDEAAAAKERVQALRALVPDTVSIGVSGDRAAATGLTAGCAAWYSVVGGLFPRTALALTRAAQSGDAELATALSERLQPLWELFRHHGSLRVISGAASHLGLASETNLPLPLRGLAPEARDRLVTVLDGLDLDVSS
ncbi:dihydrodipicolinate synthase family protein [Streptomyces sp. NPDC097640]|uniref:dihydrodipicolinate synthase family protein n=1 Tax=Streptomyces sp. NPDC097640 TaxID=3157229 RepID=UPI00332959A8